uniref:Uncharacterized protein n=1 Tax=Lepeophtheirus salmonis TaxID=72036 RepID=A0A0K2UNG4_LEPSM
MIKINNFMLIFFLLLHTCLLNDEGSD